MNGLFTRVIMTDCSTMNGLFTRAKMRMDCGTVNGMFTRVIMRKDCGTINGLFTRVIMRKDCGTMNGLFTRVIMRKDCGTVNGLFTRGIIRTGYGTECEMFARGADKSLARPTSRCRRTESIVSLERGVCSCAELQVFSCYIGSKEECQATSAISAIRRRELSSSFFPPARQGAERNSRHSDRNIRGTCTHRMPLSKTGWHSLNVVNFPPVTRLVLDDSNQ